MVTECAGAGWAAASARTLARRLRRQRRVEKGLSRASAMHWRMRTIRTALQQQWQLGDAIGCHFASLKEAIDAVKLVNPGEQTLEELEELHRMYNWAKHTAPPVGARPARTPHGTACGELEQFRCKLYETGGTEQALLAPGCWSASTGKHDDESKGSCNSGDGRAAWIGGGQCVKHAILRCATEEVPTEQEEQQQSNHEQPGIEDRWGEHKRRGISPPKQPDEQSGFSFDSAAEERDLQRDSRGEPSSGSSESSSCSGALNHAHENLGCTQVDGASRGSEGDKAEELSRQKEEAELKLQAEYREREQVQELRRAKLKLIYEQNACKEKMNEDRVRIARQKEEDRRQPRPAFQPGVRVRLSGISAKPELNGLHGTLKEYHGQKERWAVLLEDGQGEKLFKEANLVDAAEDATPAALTKAAEQAAAAIKTMPPITGMKIL